MREEARELSKDPLQNVLAGLTVAIVALPLALAFGRTAFGDAYGPAAGLWGAIIAGFLAALLGGSNYAITGPTGVLAIFTAGLIATHGGFSSGDAIAFGFLAVLLSGIMQVALGAARLGRVIEFIPYPVITGFMSGIALIIIWTGVKDAVNPGADPLGDAAGFEAVRIAATGGAALPVYAAVFLAAAAIAVTFGWPRITRRLPEGVWSKVPGSLLALLLVTVAALVVPAASGVAHIRPLPAGGPVPFTDFAVLARHPDWTRDLVVGALGLALISSIDTLLTCVIADSVTGGRTKTNRELVAQGVGNAASGLFSATQSCGAAVRTMVNVKNGGRTRLSGMSHALILVVLVLAGASLVEFIPIPALSGILIVTGIGMVEWHAIFSAHKAPKSDTAVMLSTLVLTITVGLVEAVFVGVVLAALLFIKRMTEMAHVVVERTDEETGRWSGFGGDVIVYEVRGPLFFGAASRFAQSLDRAKMGGKIVVFKMHSVTATDETGMRTFSLMHDRFVKLGVRVLIVGLVGEAREKFERFGLADRIGKDAFYPTTSEALAAAHHILRGTPASGSQPGRAKVPP